MCECSEASDKHQARDDAYVEWMQLVKVERSTCIWDMYQNKS